MGGGVLGVCLYRPYTHPKSGVYIYPHPPGFTPVPQVPPHTCISVYSVASFLVLGGGGGVKTPKCTDRKKKIVTYIIARAKYLWYGAM